MDFELSKIQAFNNISIIKLTYQDALKKADGDRKLKLESQIQRIEESERLFRHMEKTNEWYAKNLSELNKLRLENWEKER